MALPVKSDEITLVRGFKFTCASRYTFQISNIYEDRDLVIVSWIDEHQNIQSTTYTIATAKECIASGAWK